MLPPFKFYPTRKLILLYCHPTASPAKTWASCQGGLFHFHLLFRTFKKPVIFTSKIYPNQTFVFPLTFLSTQPHAPLDCGPAEAVLSYLLAFHQGQVSFHTTKLVPTDFYNEVIHTFTILHYNLHIFSF